MGDGNVERLEALAAEVERRVVDSESARLFLFGMRWRTLFILYGELDMVVPEARERMRRNRQRTST